eukprot:Gregarina_sp_Poly_1__2055@NODE_1540_length_3889_cov_9_074830_g1016_i0_p1_GENE_NODE_1540_length_3889_cov_9_074830_g1016_i0NODE_1540_length_3889_cov_9_074830_g1016_i0_p1_ORF_typecomplete_len555_score64_31DUF1506/PF07405_11/0_17_NODE_1540_length_3889_cov_9_074830_g1016_i018303494
MQILIPHLFLILIKLISHGQDEQHRRKIFSALAEVSRMRGIVAKFSEIENSKELPCYMLELVPWSLQMPNPVLPYGSFKHMIQEFRQLSSEEDLPWLDRIEKVKAAKPTPRSTNTIMIGNAKTITNRFMDWLRVPVSSQGGSQDWTCSQACLVEETTNCSEFETASIPVKTSHLPTSADVDISDVYLRKCKELFTTAQFDYPLGRRISLYLAILSHADPGFSPVLTAFWDWVKDASNHLVSILGSSTPMTKIATRFFLIENERLTGNKDWLYATWRSCSDLWRPRAPCVPSYLLGLDRFNISSQFLESIAPHLLRGTPQSCKNELALKFIDHVLTTDSITVPIDTNQDVRRQIALMFREWKSRIEGKPQSEVSYWFNDSCSSSKDLFYWQICIWPKLVHLALRDSEPSARIYQKWLLILALFSALWKADVNEDSAGAEFISGTHECIWNQTWKYRNLEWSVVAEKHEHFWRWLDEFEEQIFSIECGELVVAKRTLLDRLAFRFFVLRILAKMESIEILEQGFRWDRRLITDTWKDTESVRLKILAGEYVLEPSS